MTNTSFKPLTAREVQATIREVARCAEDQNAAMRGCVAAALAVLIATLGLPGAVDYLRDLSDLVEHDAVLPDREKLQ